MDLDFKFSAKEIIEKGRTTSENIQTIINWLPEVKESFVPKKLPDEMIVLFLLSCTNDISLTKNTIVSYYKWRKASPLLFDNRKVDCPEIQRGLKTVAYSVIAKRDENEIIYYSKIRDTYYKNLKIEYAIKIVCMILDVCQESNPPDTITIVYNMSGFGIRHLTMLHLEALKTMFAYVQEACPIKLKEVHFVNANFVLEKMLAITKMFAKPGLMEKFYCHKGVEGLSDFISKDYLPEDYGGNCPSIEELSEEMYHKLKEKEPFWEAEEQMRKQWNNINNNEY